MSHVDASIALGSAPCDAALPSSSQNDALHEECGVFGVWAPGLDVARLTYFGLKALQLSFQGDLPLDILPGAAVTAGILLLIYGGYLLATCFAAQGVIRPRRRE